VSAERRSARKSGRRRGETSVFLGIGLQIAATFLFTLMGALIRYLGDRIPLGEVIFARSFLAFIPLFAMLLWRRELASAVQMKQPWSHIWRAVTGVASMFFMFAGLALIPLADATAITFATPLLSVALAAMFLGEVVRIWRWSAVVVGLIGVLIMISIMVTNAVMNRIRRYERSSGSFRLRVWLASVLFLTGCGTTVQTTTSSPPPQPSSRFRVLT